MADETALATIRPNSLTTVPELLAAIVDLVTNAVTSEHTKRAYGRALLEFLHWYGNEGRRLDKATINAYVSYLRTSGTPASSINQRLVAIRKFAREAADNGLIDHATAEAIARAEGVRTEGKRLGNWLDKDQAQALLDAPNVATVKGIRDRAILAVLIGAALRREECAALTVEHLQQREGRWMIVDLVGKRLKIRSVPITAGTKSAIDTWLSAAGIHEGPIFRPVNKSGKVVTVTVKEADGRERVKAMTAQAIYNVVNEYAGELGLTVHPHDLRRTSAQLAKKGGAPTEQIQFTLGHASIQTTERYLGLKQDLQNAPCDVLGLCI